MEGREANFAAFQRANVCAAREGAIYNGFDPSFNTHIIALLDCGQNDVRELWIVRSPIDIGSDQVSVAVTPDNLASGQSDRFPGSWQDDVDAFVQQLSSQAAAFADVGEVADEQPFTGLHIPAEYFDMLAMLIVVVTHTARKAIHKVGDRRELGAAKSTDFAGLADRSGDVAR